MRQGDPLSLLLFCIAEEVLSRGLHALTLEGKLSQMHYSRGVYVPNHCLYADDILIFYKGTLANIKSIMHLFEVYGAFSGQLINATNSKFYTSSVPMSKIIAIATLTSFIYDNLPFVYLGVPLFKGRPKAVHLRPIFDRIKSKLSTWHGRLLSIMGRAQLVNYVISGMLVYTFHIHRWPKIILNEITKIIRNFVWSGDCNQQKICTVAWNTMCRPKDEGGLAIRDPFMVNNASLLHLTRKFLTSQDQWAQLCRHILLSNAKPKNHYIHSSIWIGLKSWVDVVIQHSNLEHW